jgi:hypothetical protein
MVLCQMDVKKMSLRFDAKLVLSVKGVVSKLGEEKLFMGLMTTPSL